MTGFVTLLGDIEAGGRMTVDVPFAVEARDPDRDIYVDNVPQDRDIGIDSMFERLRPGIFWGRSWADWSGDGQGITLISVDGCYYWLKEPNQFGHVVLRCIALRPGTWEAFCPASWTGAGTHHFQYAICFHDGDWRQADPQRRSLELRHPPTVARVDYPCDATLPPISHSFLRLEGPALLSAYYREAEDIYVRLYESAGQGGEVALTFDWTPSSAQAIDLRDRPMDVPVQVKGKQVQIALQPWQIVTLRLSRA
jgi:hypothetical protein